MKRLMLLSTLTLSSLAFAESPAPETVASAEAVVKKELLAPLATKERAQSRFSRRAMPAAERRVRVTDAQPSRDANGAEFFTFAVDVRHGYFDEDKEKGWQKDALAGCVYPADNEVFVKQKDSFRPAAFLTGKKVPVAPAERCVAAPAQAVAQAR